MTRLLPWAAVLSLGCLALPEAVEAPEAEVEELSAEGSALTRRAHRRHQRCLRQARRGRRPAWTCGGRERAVPPAACTDRQWVARRRGRGPCPEARSHRGEWRITRPFSRSRDRQLQRVCLYTWAAFDADRPEPDIAALPDRPSIRLERDCEVVSAHALPGEVTDALRASWETQIELPDWSVADPQGAPTPASVRVAVIDNGFGGVANSPDLPADMVDHAEAMSSIVRAIGCPERGEVGYCPVGAPVYGAMPYIRRGQEGELGGYFGTHLEYAAAVAEAVDDWRTEPARTRPAHLVLNLSLGWTGEHDVTSTGRLSGQVALWATRYAACKGALLIAAAGNRGVDGGEGPLYPAGWESRPRDCGDAGDLAPYAPLVHAVGGVDGRDTPLSIARAGASPRIVAPAALVSVQLETLSSQEDHDATEVMSGTSLAAAATSGVAAMVWSLRPELPPWAVMQRVWASGEPTGAPAEFAYAGAPERRRLSATRAFEAACPDGLEVGRCPLGDARPEGSEPRPAGIPAGPDMAQIAELLYAQAAAVASDPDAPPTPDAESTYAAPYTVPQPGTPTCPICGFVGATLYGKLQADPAGTATIYAKTASDGFTVKLPSLEDGAPFKLDLAAELPIDELVSAWLLVPVSAEGKVSLTSSELFIY